MKILMLNYEFPPIGGGAANANLYLLKQYAGKPDLQIDVLTSAPSPGLTKEIFADNITIHKVGIHKKHLHFWRRTEVIEWLIKAGPVYKKLIKENDYDLAHAFFGFPTGWLSYRNANKLPYIISLRGSDVPGDNARLQLDYKILGPIFKGIWNKASGLVACSDGLKQRAMKFMPNVKVDVIPNGVELENYYPSNETRETRDEIRLITSGRLSSTKRVDMLIEAIDILQKRGYKIRFTIAGDGSLGDSLKELISKKNLKSQIDMLGRVEPANMPDLYRASDIYISATMQEGMSNSMLEALACGLPVVTTYCEGVEELITADNGIVTKHAHADLLADAIQTLINDRSKLKQMSIAARKRAEMFNWQNAADKYINYYNATIDKNKKCRTNNIELKTKNSKLKTKKVCFVIMKAYPLFNPEVKSVFGGAEVDFYNLATELAKDKNFDVSCIVADYGQPDTEVRENVTLIKSLDFKKNIISQTVSLWRAMKKVNASIYLQKTAAWGTLFVYMFCKLYKRKFIYRTAKKEESTGDWPRNTLQRKAFHFSLRHADAVLAQNVKDKENLNSKLGISATAIPNGHKLSSSIESERDIILWVGRSTKVKRPELFIKLAESAPEKMFLMICQRGTGDNEYDILISNAKKVNNLEYIERVEFSEIDSYFQRAKLLVNTSDTEGFPNTFIQACKAGTPILSLNVNPDDFLNNYKCGLCANGDWIAFNNMLEEILGPTAGEYSKNARQYAEQNHDIKHIIERYKEIFNNLMDGEN